MTQKSPLGHTCYCVILFAANGERTIHRRIFNRAYDGARCAKRFIDKGKAKYAEVHKFTVWQDSDQTIVSEWGTK